MFIFDQLLSYSPGIGGGGFTPRSDHPCNSKGGGIFKIWKMIKFKRDFIIYSDSWHMVWVLNWYSHPSTNEKKSKNPPPPSLGEWALVLKPHSVHENGRRDWYSFFFLVGPCYCRWSFLCDTWWLVASVHKMGSSHRPYSCTEWGLSNKAQTLRSRCPK